MKPFFLVLATLAAANGALAADQHLTLRLEDGLPVGGYALPVTIVVPVTAGKGGAGVALAPFYEYGPHSVDGSGLQVAGDRITGTLSGKRRTGGTLPVWTIDAAIKDGRITGTSTTPAADRLPTVRSRVAGYVDAPTGGAWMIECGMPWTDGGSAAKLGADGGDYHISFIVRLRLDPKTGKVVYAGGGDAGSEARVIQAEKFQGSPESFTADISCLAKDGKTPIQISLKGGRIGRGGIVEATVQSAAGRGTEWKGAATVWAWPDAPGFTGGREQDLGKWQYTAQADPALVEAAVKEAATPIHPVEPGTAEVWQSQSMQRDVPRCTAPPTFDIRPLPVAAKYRLSVTRIVGKPMTLVDEEVADPFAALAAAWDKPVLGKFRFQFSIDGKPATAMDVWLGGRVRHATWPSWLTPVMQGASYRVRVHKARDTAAPMEFTVKQPWAPLTDAWAKLAPGDYLLEIQGIGADGKELGARPWSTPFEKVATFQGPYFSGPARPYKEAALALARWTCDHATLARVRGHQTYTPPGAGDNGGCQELLGAISAGLVRYRLATDPNEREAGLMMAIETGDHMRAGCLARGGMPKAYKGGIANTHLFGTGFLDLYAATGDQRWKDAAEMVAKAYARLQLPNGTWAELEDNGRSSVDPATAKPATPAHQAIYDAGLLPGIHGPHPAEFDGSEVLWFLGRLRTELKTDAFRECEDKAYRWVMDYSVKDFFWRNQGHESMCMVVPFIYTGRSSSYFALYLLECAPTDRRDLKLAAELMRFCETRHMNWSRPDPSSVRGVMPNLVCTGIRHQGSAIWLGSRFAMAWAQLGRLDGNRLHAEKARAIMDAITHAQHPVTGSVGTELELNPRFTRFAVNAGRCAWNLMRYADLIATASNDGR